MNKLTKFSRAILAIAIMLCVALPTFAHDFSVDGIYYNYLDKTEKTVRVTYKGYYYDSYSNEYTGSVTIPSSVTYNGNTYSVISIGDEAFYDCDGLTSITIPNSVTSIGSAAFYDCTGLTSITIPNSVISIGDAAFYACSNLETVINLSNLIFSKGSSDYGKIAYYANRVINAPNVSMVEDFVFSKVDNVNILGAYLGNATELILPTDFNGENYIIGNDAFYNCSGLTSVTIPNSVTSIGDNAFCNCNGLTGVNYNAENCTSMGSSNYSVFGGCSNLKIVNIGSSVKSIPSYAFYECTGLTSVTISNSVTSIGRSAFSGCYRLTSITIPNSVTSIGDEAFSICSGLTEVNISDLSAWCKIDFVSYGANPLLYANKLKLNGAEIKDLVIPNDITEIKNYAFNGCRGLTSITIPNSVTSIGNSAFRGCTGLTSVTIPNSVTEIGYGAFNSCTGLTVVNYNAENCTSIGSSDESVFRDCSNLKTINIGNEVKTIPSYAFYYCTGLTSITIPNSVTSIGDEAFNCDNLRIVKSLSNTPQQCNDYAFGSNPAALLMVPKGSMMSYMIADGWRHFTKIQEFEVDDAVKPVLTIAYPEGGVIKQKVDNGTILELQIVPSNGWECNSVTFNGVDVTNNLDADGNYNTPSITADSQLSIVFVKDASGVESTLANDIKVCVNGNTVTILGADEFDDVEIYNTSGINVYNGIEKSITLDSNGIYILTVEGETFKFAM